MQNLPLALQVPDSQVVVRAVRLIDVDALHSRCWPELSRDTIYRLVSRAQYLVRRDAGIGLTAVHKGLVVGYGQLTVWDRTGEISDLVVTERLRGQGMGTALIQHLIRHARQLNACCVDIGVAPENRRARALYQHLGFVDHHMLEIELGRGPVEVQYLRLPLPA